MSDTTVREIDLPPVQQPAAGQPALALDLAFVPSLRVRAQVVLGHAELTVGALRAMKRDDVVELDRFVDAPIDLVIDGHVVARGTLVAVGEHFGLRVLEAPQP
ncbi:FliM/FliN family flagellar motor switch protein [Niveibacterium sp. COAC-50]|uniref:FliM/FliN family flagellar motor switch protein n=1 Tax=Niveibacterium sp. COAC-50 TaxID=2729384 RepID=UPI0015561C73|nr:FliM/FliN family flagellar motor switch protein [Niveibacterium sp. COAC-50]